MGLTNEGLVEHAWKASHSAVKNALTSLAAKTGEVNYAVDCSGLIKTYTMGGIGNVSYSGSKDYSANSYYANSPEKGDISSMPEIIGLAVHMDGHIGIYVGNGEVIESTPSTKFATQSHGGGGVCKGNDVTQLQKNLLALGFDPKGVDVNWLKGENKFMYDNQIYQM